MKKDLLKELSEQKGYPCISIILSTRLASFDDKEKIQLEVKNGITKVEKELKGKCGEDQIKKLVRKTKSLAERINLNHPGKGVGMFVSQNYNRLIYFPLPVKDKIIIDSSFEVRDVINNLNLLTPYHVLLLSKGNSKLFKGVGVELTEVIDEKFPYKYKEEFQLQRAHPGSFYNDEESKINQSRLERYFRQVDHLLGTYLESSPLILMGVQKYLSTYKGISNYQSLLIGDVAGSYDKHNVRDITQLILPVIEARHEKEEKKIIEMARDAIGENKAVTGIQEVWNVARQGTGNKLVVERDYACMAYLSNPYKELILDRASREDLTEIPDAIEAVIDELMEHHDTQVHFVDNDALKEFGRIVLTTKF